LSNKLGNNRLLLEDLITRLSELTRIRAQGEQEVEVLTLLNILEDTQHPRVPAALAGFAESWKQTQGNAINEKTQAILKTAEK
jgi:hydroxylamine reductase (hybrid-cluster protein)